MQTLLRKLVTHNSTTLSHNPPCLVYTRAPKAITFLLISSETQIKNHIWNCFTSYPLHHFHSWHSKHNLPGKISGFFSEAVVREHFMSNSCNNLLRIRSRRLVDYGPNLFGAQFSGQRFDFNRGFNSFTRGRKSWFDRLTTKDVVVSLIVANVAVFLTGRVAGEEFMMNNFTISLDNIKHGRLHTLITNAFSHIDIGHIICNIIGLYFFGMNIGRVFGPELLLKLYLAGAIGGLGFFSASSYLGANFIKGPMLTENEFFLSASSYLGANFIKGPMDPSGLDHRKIHAMGASGAVKATMLLQIFVFPNATIYLDFIIPVPAILLGIYFIGRDMLRIMEVRENSLFRLPRLLLAFPISSGIFCREPLK